jgi:hypothetical protein
MYLHLALHKTNEHALEVVEAFNVVEIAYADVKS